MTKTAFFKTQKNFYFLGVGGVSMSAIASFLIEEGYKVLGYDKVFSDKVKALIEKGLVFVKPSEIDLKDHLVVYTSAVEKTPYFNAIKKSGAKIIKRSKLLYEIQKLFKINIAVCGCHGKTTTTAMLAHVFKCANARPTAFIGGEDTDFSNYLSGEKKYCITEACEYKKNFLDLKADYAIVTNVDNDHLDSYIGIEDVKKTFEKFISNSVAIINVDDANSKHLKGKTHITFGINSKADYVAKNIVETSFGTEFTVLEWGKYSHEIKINLKGSYNVYNALSVIALARQKKIGWHTIKKGLISFKGVKRRSENIGKMNCRKIICDYAHHPTEIGCMLNTVDKDRTAIIFQPHTYSRTALLMEDFVNVLKDIPCLIIYKTYPAREKFDKRGSARTLYLNIIRKSKTKVYYVENTKQLKRAIKELSRDKNLLFVGAGDIYSVAKILATKKENGT